MSKKRKKVITYFDSKLQVCGKKFVQSRDFLKLCTVTSPGKNPADAHEKRVRERREKRKENKTKKKKEK